MIKSASVHRKGKFSSDNVVAAATELRDAMGDPAALAFAFVTPDYVPHIEEFSEIVRVDGHVIDLVGATGLGLISNSVEEENDPGFCLLGLSAKGTQIEITTFSQEMVEENEGRDFAKVASETPPANTWVVLMNPFSLDVESWLAQWAKSHPGIPCVGGLASGTEDGEHTAIFHNGNIVDGLAVGISGSLRVVSFISQGCRPIGEPLTVTKAESNVVYSLGAHPAYEALESAFETLSDGEKASAKGNLFAGLAGTEYVEDFKPGDFLIRNILGADPDTGAVVIGGIPRVGQTLQYQLRDRASADAELRAVLSRAAAECGRPVASLLFSCAGRGSRFFGSKSHDASLVEEILGDHASIGFFCNGEIGPVGAKNCIHSYTASCAVFVEDVPSA